MAGRRNLGRMLRASMRDADNRPMILLGLTDENWRLLSSSLIQVDIADMGVDAKIVIFKGKDQKALKARLVEMGVADRSLLDVPLATPEESQKWHPKRNASKDETGDG